MPSAVIKIGLDPTIEIGPVTVAWHGLTSRSASLAGALVAGRDARRRGLDAEPLYTVGVIVVVSAVVGGRLYYLMEHRQLFDTGAWLGTRGFTFYGGFIAAALGIVAFVLRRGLSVSCLDAIAVGLPLGIAVGRIGDVINGEHYGPETNFFLGVQNTHPEADVPRHDLAHHSGGLYEVLIGAIVFAIGWPLRTRVSRPTALVWTVIGLLAAGRFVELFVRSHSDTLALGLETAQWTSLLLLILAALGAWLTLGRRKADGPRPDG